LADSSDSDKTRTIGLVFAVSTLCYLLFTPLAGVLGDRCSGTSGNGGNGGGTRNKRYLVILVGMLVLAGGKNNTPDLHRYYTPFHTLMSLDVSRLLSVVSPELKLSNQNLRYSVDQLKQELLLEKRNNNSSNSSSNSNSNSGGASWDRTRVNTLSNLRDQLQTLNDAVDVGSAVILTQEVRNDMLAAFNAVLNSGGGGGGSPRKRKR
jgi:hypothetical protein